MLRGRGNRVNVRSRDVQHMATLARLAIRSSLRPSGPLSDEDVEHLHHDLMYVAALERDELHSFLQLANTHHVVVRALTSLYNAAAGGGDTGIGEWCHGALTCERARISRAVAYLHAICDAFEATNCEVAVIKSLDHWPDLGSDLDLYTSADKDHVHQVMREQFSARPIERSWGDRLANKWNYRVPGLPELVEVHVQYLGQTGEHATIAQRVVKRRIQRTVGGDVFQIPAPEERIVIATLQRVYRHFYFRLCDMVDTAELLQAGAVDFAELKSAAECAGIWPGVATFLCLVENYVASYGAALHLPLDAEAAAHARNSHVKYGTGFLRVAKSTALSLYSSQLLQACLRQDFRALMRLPLLPPLAVSALVAHSLTGNDKGIW